MKRAVANHCADARELWERLAARGVIPSEWIDDPRRQFAATAPGRVMDGRGPRPERRDAVSMEAAITLGADAEGVTTAEALAREIVGGLASWRVAQPDRVRWWVVADEEPQGPQTPSTPSKVSPLFNRSPVMRAYYTLAVAELSRGRRTPKIDRDQINNAAVAARCVFALVDQLATDLEASRQWQIAVEDGWVYNGVKFARLSCPFRALLSLWETGYVLVSIEEDAVTLGARLL